MYYEKLIRITEEQKSELKAIQTKIFNNGGYISLNQLIRDSIQVYLTNCHEEAIKKYSPYYKWKTERK